VPEENDFIIIDDKALDNKTTDQRLGFAIVGLGDFATNAMMPRFKNTDYCKITALVSGHPDKAERLAQQYGVDPKNIYNYDNFDDIKDNKDVDIVYIVLPNGMHAEYTIRAAKAGKHVLCEKPMANTVEECQSMIDACKEANVKLMIAYRCHYEPFNLDAIERIRKGELGNIKQITADSGFNIQPDKSSAAKWRVNKKLAGGGSLMDIGIYSLNATRYLTGEEPTQITAFESSDKSDPRFQEVEDRIHFVLRFPSGVLASVTSSYSIQGVRHYRVIGDEGWLDLDPATDQNHHVSITANSLGRTQNAISEGNEFAAELDHIAECVKENKTPKTPGEEGLKDVRIIMAAYQSAIEKRPIPL
jgi:predicted dehydrogenase